ncbi:hypothetical protein Tco_0656724 [Tanacetum coccineum]|uniref:Uncharacterized protein n=1 Tax=Tanacetum coccineum TaxID=301880 RepID=A0ABQ4XA95_9ASTR
MGTNVTSSSGSVLEEPEIQKLQMQAKNLKENSLNKLNALKTTIQHLSSSNHSMYYEFREAFHRLFDANEGLFRGRLSKYNTNAREILQDFNAYTSMEAQTFKETIIQNMDSIEQCIIERASHEQELKMTLKKLSERQLQIQQCKVQEEVLPAESSSTDTPLKQENKTILKQLKKANASLTQELEKCKTNHDETSRALGEATSSRDSCLIALQTKQTELEKYTALNDRRRIPIDTSDPANRFCPNGAEQ